MTVCALVGEEGKGMVKFVRIINILVTIIALMIIMMLVVGVIKAIRNTDENLKINKIYHKIPTNPSHQ